MIKASTVVSNGPSDAAVRAGGWWMSAAVRASTTAATASSRRSERRSGPTVRTLASGLFLITRTLADGLRLYLAAVVLKIMLGWDLWLAVTVMGTGTVVYTVFGGIRAVVWTDVVQFAVYMLGAIDTEQLAAHQIAIQCAAFTFMVPFGLAQAATVRAGIYDALPAGAALSSRSLLLLGCRLLGR